MRNMLVVPEEGLVVATMSSARTVPTNCTGVGSWTAETSLELAQVYSRYLRNATQPQNAQAAAVMEQARLRALRAVEQALAANRSLNLRLSPKNDQDKIPSHQKETDNKHSVKTAVSVKAAEGDTEYGACYCYCGSDAGVGRCFDNVNVTDCLQKDFPSRNETVVNVSRFCPDVSVVMDCFGFPNAPPPCRLGEGYATVSCVCAFDDGLLLLLTITWRVSLCRATVGY